MAYLPIQIWLVSVKDCKYHDPVWWELSSANPSRHHNLHLYLSQSICFEWQLEHFYRLRTPLVLGLGYFAPASHLRDCKGYCFRFICLVDIFDALSPLFNSSQTLAIPWTPISWCLSQTIQSSSFLNIASSNCAFYHAQLYLLKRSLYCNDWG